MPATGLRRREWAGGRGTNRGRVPAAMRPLPAAAIVVWSSPLHPPTPAPWPRLPARQESMRGFSPRWPLQRSRADYCQPHMPVERRLDAGFCHQSAANFGGRASFAVSMQCRSLGTPRLHPAALDPAPHVSFPITGAAKDFMRVDLLRRSPPAVQRGVEASRVNASFKPSWMACTSAGFQRDRSSRMNDVLSARLSNRATGK